VALGVGYSVKHQSALATAAIEGRPAARLRICEGDFRMQNGRERSRHPAERAGYAGPGVAPIKRAAEVRFERPRVYFRFTPNQFILSVAGSSETYRTTPHIAYDRRTNRVKEIGPEAQRYVSASVVVENGFQADRLVIGNVDLAEIAFRHAFGGFMQRVRKGQLSVLRWMKPRLVIHPVHLDHARISPLEMQCLVDIGLRAGAHSAAVYLGPELSDLLLRTGRYEAAFISI